MQPRAQKRRTGNTRVLFLWRKIHFYTYAGHQQNKDTQFVGSLSFECLTFCVTLDYQFPVLFETPAKLAPKGKRIGLSKI
jgi:hypothetical protein